jgi:hypothetical protein
MFEFEPTFCDIMGYCVMTISIDGANVRVQVVKDCVCLVVTGAGQGDGAEGKRDERCRGDL